MNLSLGAGCQNPVTSGLFFLKLWLLTLPENDEIEILTKLEKDKFLIEKIKLIDVSRQFDFFLNLWLLTLPENDEIEIDILTKLKKVNFDRKIKAHQW